jgi:hypothetical protein
MIKTKPILIMSIVIVTFLVSGMAFGTLSFAASTGSSTGTERLDVTLCGGLPRFPCKHNPPQPLPTSGIPVVTSCKWDPPNEKKTCSPTLPPPPSEVTLKTRADVFGVAIEEIHHGSYDISVHPIPFGVKPTYAGHCHGTLSPGKSEICIIDPYGG